MGWRAERLRDPVTLAVGALAVHRLTRLVTDDEITRPLRDRLAKWAAGDAYRPVHPQIAYLAACPWCLSVWAAAAWAVLAATAPRAALAAGVPLAWSSVTGLLASVE